MSREGVRESYYDQYWRDEHVKDSPHQRWKIAALEDVLARTSHRSILDVGAGDGTVLSRVANGSVRRVGAELADDAIDKMGARGLEAVKVDLESGTLPWADETFDVTMCLDVLEHVFAPDKLLGEIRRVTAHDGHIVLAVPNAFNLANRAAYALGRHVDFMDVAHHTGATFSEHIRFFSERVLDKLIAGEDLRIVERKYYFPDELSDSRFKLGAWAGRLVTLPRLHERLPSLFALGFFVVCVRA
jgi:2-polyprenyl-3-methyl-5-hydroxy-6-metoxy-1,4-benzoquinol methylase